MQDTRKVAQSVLSKPRGDGYVFTDYDVQAINENENPSRKKFERQEIGQSPSHQAAGKKSKRCVLSRTNVQNDLDKRMRNNLASRKSRELRRLRLEETDKKIEQLQKENELLRRNKTVYSILIDLFID